MPPPRNVVITLDNVSDVVAGIVALAGKQVLVGIPEANTDRENENDSPITNAALGYIHENGAPEANIPARPFLVPGVTKSNPKTIPRLRKAAEAALDGNPNERDRQLKAAGQEAEITVKETLEAGEGWQELSPSTIASRRYNRRTKSIRPSEQEYMDLIDTGMDPATAQSAAGIHALINTGQLRNAVTSIVREKK